MPASILINSSSNKTQSDCQKGSNFIEKHGSNPQNLTLFLREKSFRIEHSSYIKSPLLLSYAQDFHGNNVITSFTCNIH